MAYQKNRDRLRRTIPNLECTAPAQAANVDNDVAREDEDLGVLLLQPAVASACFVFEFLWPLLFGVVLLLLLLLLVLMSGGGDDGDGRDSNGVDSDGDGSDGDGAGDGGDSDTDGDGDGIGMAVLCSLWLSLCDPQ